jgi:NADH-quinone oxidoreductase subunit G
MKVKKPKNVDIGPRIRLDDERCIMCSRCIRFMDEVAGDPVLGFTQRGTHTTLTVHPGRLLDHNYSLNTADICPVGALTSNDFRFQMRVWFLKETPSIDVNCGTGCNITIHTRGNTIHRITPRQNNEVNSNWMPDSHRLNFHYIDGETRLTEPLILEGGTHRTATWPEALTNTTAALAIYAPSEIAIIASARMTNEELFLARRLAAGLKIENFDVLPRPQKGDGFLISDDGNPNSTGAKLLGLATGKLPAIAAGVASGQITGLIVLGEDAVDCGISEEHLKNLETLVVTGILANATTRRATVVLPTSGWAEKRGIMINIKGRLQRLNQAIQPPGQARDDWEVLRDLVQATGGSNGVYTIEEVFKMMASEVPALQGLTLSRIGDLGTELALKS